MKCHGNTAPASHTTVALCPVNPAAATAPLPVLAPISQRVLKAPLHRLNYPMTHESDGQRRHKTTAPMPAALLPPVRTAPAVGHHDHLLHTSNQSRLTGGAQGLPHTSGQFHATRNESNFLYKKFAPAYCPEPAGKMAPRPRPLTLCQWSVKSTGRTIPAGRYWQSCAAFRPYFAVR